MPDAIATTTLEQFLTRPDIESSPAWELIDGYTIQKPMPTLFHSRLQRNLVNIINSQTEQFEAIQELRCIIPPYSPVPDIAIIECDRLPETDGSFDGSPDWVIEIRSPDQSTLDLQNKILHCLRNGTQIAWLIDINRRQIWVWQGDDLPIIYSGADVLPDCGTQLELTVDDVMALTRQK